jgi:hypothetical protein
VNNPNPNLLSMHVFSPNCAMTCSSVISSRIVGFYEVKDGKPATIASLILSGEVPDVHASTENGMGGCYYSFYVSARIDTRQ